MKSEVLMIQSDTLKNERPYYLISDNSNSCMKVTRMNDFAIVNELNCSKKMGNVLVQGNYFDNEYLKKDKSDAYPYQLDNIE